MLSGSRRRRGAGAACRSLGILASVGVAFVLAAGACSGGDPDDSGRSAREEGSSTGEASTAAAAQALRAGPNLLLVTLDTLRADHLGVYGYDAIETPNLDSLAADGVLFTQAISSTPLTLPAHTSVRAPGGALRTSCQPGADYPTGTRLGSHRTDSSPSWGA